MLLDNKNKALTCATTWMNPENIMLRKKTQSQKAIVYDSTYMKCPEQAHL